MIFVDILILNSSRCKREYSNTLKINDTKYILPEHKFGMYVCKTQTVRENQKGRRTQIALLY